ncbi:MAG: hypothetical protein ACLPN6_25070 [Streptosporangiaceae bacterium]|nr:hypothetical protein [Actinomycetota bacterium]
MRERYPQTGRIAAIRRPAGAGWRGGAMALAAAAVLALAGCAKMDASLGKQTATVTFSSGTPVATLLHVRAACSHVPNVQPQPLPSRQTVTTMMDELVYTTTNASDANLAELQQCLQKFSSVQGIDFEDASDEG